MKIYIKIFISLISILFIFSCQPVKDALEGKQRKKVGEEFLIEKKNPLSVPSSFDELPQPTGWRMLVLPFRMKEKTDGGIIMGTETIDRQQVASQCGNVLAMGSECYKDKDRYPTGPWCKVGDWVVFARYAGSRIQIEGGEVRLLNEDEVLATVKNPEDILHQF